MHTAPRATRDARATYPQVALLLVSMLCWSFGTRGAFSAMFWSRNSGRALKVQFRRMLPFALPKLDRQRVARPVEET